MASPEAKEYAAAKARGQRLRRSSPYATQARYEAKIGRVLVTLNTGVEVAFAPERIQALCSARPADMKKIEITPSGYELFFPALDEGIFLPGLLRGVFGTQRWMRERDLQGEQRKVPRRNSRQNTAGVVA